MCSVFLDCNTTVWVLTSNTLNARDSGEVLVPLSMKKRFSMALPSFSSKTMVSVDSVASEAAAAAAASLSFLASSMRLWRLPMNRGDWRQNRNNTSDRAVGEIRGNTGSWVRCDKCASAEKGRLDWLAWLCRGTSGNEYWGLRIELLEMLMFRKNLCKILL